MEQRWWALGSAIGPDEDCYVDEPIERLKQPGPTAPFSKAYPP
jgi:hypothetical protein